MFGEPGKENGQFNTPHGLWIDARPGREPSLVVADRANKRLQWFTLEGKHLKTLDGFILPANIDILGDVLLVPDLSARITLLDKNDQVITHLGEDPEWRAQVLKDGMKMRKDENGRRLGRRQIPASARRLLRSRRQHLRRRVGAKRAHHAAAESELTGPPSPSSSRVIKGSLPAPSIAERCLKIAGGFNPRLPARDDCVDPLAQKNGG